jgi:protein ImuA
MFTVCSNRNDVMYQSKASKLEALKERISAIGASPVLADEQIELPVDGLLHTPRGYVHEVFSDKLTNAGAAFGFALTQAKGMLSPARPGLLIFQLRTDATELGLPYGLGFHAFGLEETAFVFVRADSIIELLWAIEEAIACGSVGALIADIAYPHKALDFTASRRLALRAAATRSSLFIVRYSLDREASAARYRWRVEPQLSAAPRFDDRATGRPRWLITLEKGSLANRKLGHSEQYLVDLTKNGLVPADSTNRGRSSTPAVTTLPRPESSPMGHRLYQTG